MNQIKSNNKFTIIENLENKFKEHISNCKQSEKSMNKITDKHDQRKTRKIRKKQHIYYATIKYHFTNR